MICNTSKEQCLIEQEGLVHAIISLSFNNSENNNVVNES